MITIDGSRGEGGGQIIRTSLALSVITGRAVTIENVRAKRAKPGLKRQHLTAVRAAARIGSANVTGDELNSGRLVFRPQTITPGHYEFSIGSAGSASLVFQTVLPALLCADGPSHLVLEGGTHNSMSPPFDFLAKTFLPLLRQMGAKVDARLERHGFYPAGGGRFVVDIEPAKLKPLTVESRGEVLDRRARVLSANLPQNVATREKARLEKQLGWRPNQVTIEHPESRGPGNAILLEIESEALTTVITGFGKKGRRAEAVVDDVVTEYRKYIEHDTPVGEHLADQLLLPLALAGGGRFRTVPPSDHTFTQVDTIRRFMDVQIDLREEARRVWAVEVG